MNDFDSSFTARSAVFNEALKLTSKDCLDAICQTIKTRFNARSVLVGSLRIVEAEYLFIEAAYTDIKSFDFTGYTIKDTPCQDVIDNGSHLTVLDNVRGGYPETPIMTALAAKAYVGFPLPNGRGGARGVLAIEWPEAITQDRANELVQLVSPFLTRISEELRRHNTSHAFKAMMNPVEPKTGSPADVFRTVVRQAAELSGVRTVVLANCASPDLVDFKILAAHSDGETLEDVEGQILEYKGTPCKNMLSQDLFFCPKDLRKMYPDAQLLEDIEAESYLGFGFRDRSGKTIGHLAFVHDRPINASAKDCEIMQVIASRAGSELQRHRIEEERNAMETALRVRSKLESLGTMAGTIAHDFNNQLTAMIGNTELALLDIPPAHAAHSSLKLAEASMWRARDVIGEILDFAGNYTDAPLETLLLCEIVANAVGEFGPHGENHDRIAYHIQEGLPEIRARRVQLVQILSNLIANGLDAIEGAPDNKVQINAFVGRVPPSDRDKCLTGHSVAMPETCVVLEIKDSGRGMDRETAEQIFDPYFSTKGVSRGLGLSSVLGIAKRLKAGFTFDTQIGRGTVFRFYFTPVEQDLTQTQTANANALPAAPQHPKGRILLVDDAKPVQSTVSELLKAIGYEVQQAARGEDAIKLARTLPRFDAAVIDVVMPGLNGFETLDALRRMHPDLPAVLVSGFNENNLPKSIKDSEFTRFLTKPFGIKGLRDHLDALTSTVAHTTV